MKQADFQPAPRDRWRSLLFVPANNKKALGKISLRGMDVVIVDLEDSVPPVDKANCRANLKIIVDEIVSAGCEVIIRVNSDDDHFSLDLQEACLTKAHAVMIPKVCDAHDIRKCEVILQDAESEFQRDRPMSILALIERPAAIFKVEEIAKAPRVIGLALGSEDFALEMGVDPTPDCLVQPCQIIAMAAAATGISAIGLPDSLARFDDLDRFAATARHARRIGMTGALCIHPSQVPTVNAMFGPTEEQIVWARKVIGALGDGSDEYTLAQVDGMMIDRPIIGRAKSILNRVKA